MEGIPGAGGKALGVGGVVALQGDALGDRIPGDGVHVARNRQGGQRRMIAQRARADGCHIGTTEDGRDGQLRGRRIVMPGDDRVILRLHNDVTPRARGELRALGGKEPVHRIAVNRAGLGRQHGRSTLQQGGGHDATQQTQHQREGQQLLQDRMLHGGLSSIGMYNRCTDTDHQ